MISLLVKWCGFSCSGPCKYCFSCSGPCKYSWARISHDCGGPNRQWPWDIRPWDRALSPENLKKKSLKIGQIIKELEPKMWGNVIRYCKTAKLGRLYNVSHTNFPLKSYNCNYKDVNINILYICSEFLLRRGFLVRSYMSDEVLIAVRPRNVRDDCLYIYRHNFLVICLIFKLFFSNFQKD